jgi:lauroyl/myristoyl acyltransferase
LRSQNLFSLMELVLYILARGVITVIQALPLRVVARVGRIGGAVAYLLDARHRKMTVRNMTMCFGSEKSASEIKALAKENFRRIGENFGCAAKTASMTFEELKPHVEFVGAAGLEKLPGPEGRPVLVAIGHFGNFELYARFGQLSPMFKCGTTYRGLKQESLNQLLLSMREKSGCEFFERRFQGAELRAFMNQPNVILGLLSDQHGGTNGLRMPFLGHECSTSAAPALFAVRYNCALLTGFCYRVGLAQWRIEAGAEIPTHENGVARSTMEIMGDINRAFEAAVRRDPSNWFWVHNRWKALGKPVGRKAARRPGREDAVAAK